MTRAWALAVVAVAPAVASAAFARPQPISIHQARAVSTKGQAVSLFRIRAFNFTAMFKANGSDGTGGSYDLRSTVVMNERPTDAQTSQSVTPVSAGVLVWSSSAGLHPWVNVQAGSHFDSGSTQSCDRTQSSQAGISLTMFKRGNKLDVYPVVPTGNLAFDCGGSTYDPWDLSHFPSEMLRLPASSLQKDHITLPLNFSDPVPNGIGGTAGTQTVTGSVTLESASACTSMPAAHTGWSAVDWCISTARARRRRRAGSRPISGALTNQRTVTRRARDRAAGPSTARDRLS
jgi:hypothetical protein